MANESNSDSTPGGGHVNDRFWCSAAHLSSQALFLEVMAEKTDQRCSTFVLPQCGQLTPPSSDSTRDKILENVFLQAWQKNSEWGIQTSDR